MCLLILISICFLCFSSFFSISLIFLCFSSSNILSLFSICKESLKPWHHSSLNLLGDAQVLLFDWLYVSASIYLIIFHNQIYSLINKFIKLIWKQVNNQNNNYFHTKSKQTDTTICPTFPTTKLPWLFIWMLLWLWLHFW